MRGAVPHLVQTFPSPLDCRDPPASGRITEGVSYLMLPITRSCFVPVRRHSGVPKGAFFWQGGRGAMCLS